MENNLKVNGIVGGAEKLATSLGEESILKEKDEASKLSGDVFEPQELHCK